MACMCPRWWNQPRPIHAYKLSLVSVFITLVAAVLGLLAYMPTGSSLVLTWGLENLVDLLSSLVVLWRFFNPGSTPDRVESLKKREKRASVAISLILFLLGIGIIVSSMIDFKVGAEEVPDLSQNLIIIVSLIFTIIFFTLTMIKLQMSVLLDSRALLKDGYCSLFGTILACSLFLNTLVVAGIPKLWWLDPLISLVVGVASLFLGLRSVMIQTFEKKIPIWDPRWWIFSQGNVTLEEANKIDEENQQQQQPPILYDDSHGGDADGSLQKDSGADLQLHEEPSQIDGVKEIELTS